VRVLVTRPEPDGERTAQKLRARGCDVLLAPVLQIKLIKEADLGAGSWDAVALTSANAAEALKQHPRRRELVALPASAPRRAASEAKPSRAASNTALPSGLAIRPRKLTRPAATLA